MIAIIVAVRMRVAGSVRVHVLVLVEDDLQPAPEGIGDATQRGEARNMVTAFKTRDHGLGHREPLRELLLRLAGVLAEFEQAVSALGGDGGAVVEACAPRGTFVRLNHALELSKTVKLCALAQLRSPGHPIVSSNGARRGLEPSRSRAPSMRSRRTPRRRSIPSGRRRRSKSVPQRQRAVQCSFRRIVGGRSLPARRGWGWRVGLPSTSVSLEGM